MNQDIITSIGMEQLLADHEAVCSRIKQAHALLQEAQTMADATGLGKVLATRFHKFMRMQDFLKAGSEPEATSYTDQGAWQHLFAQSHIFDIMSAKRKDALRRSIDSGECPAFTVDAIRGTFGDLFESRQATFEISVVECFEALDSRYATNSTARFTPRIVIRRLISGQGTIPDPGTGDEVDDLLRYMALFDGKPIPHAGTIREAIMESALNGSDRRFENEYIDLRWFKNGNAHLTFKRLDLMDALNKALAKGRENSLPASRKARYMPSH